MTGGLIKGGGFRELNRVEVTPTLSSLSSIKLNCMVLAVWYTAIWQALQQLLVSSV